MNATFFKDNDPDDGRLVYYGSTESGLPILPSNSPIGRWDGSFGLVITADLQLNDYVGNRTACWAYADKTVVLPAQFN